MTKTLLSAAALLLFTAGCESVAESEPVNPATLQTDFVGYAPDNSEFLAIQAMTEDERNAYGKAKIDEQITLTQGIAEAPDWQTADTFVKAELAREAVTPSHVRNLMASVSMINQHLLSAPETPERQEALIYYADMAANAGSANANVIDHVLLALGDQAPVEKTREIAGRTLETVDRVLSRTTDCGDCTITEKATRADGQGTQQASPEAISRLSAYAER